MEEIIYKEVNSCNTPITEDIFKGLDRKSRTDFLTFFNEIKFIQNLTSLDRERAKDRPRDGKGRVIVDLENPHILEDMSYFTERADFFRINGRYTDIYPNPAPGSEYKKFWDEERRRCKEGYIRESDGEWVTGYHYFYLNYGPILKVEEDNTDMALIAAEIIEGGLDDDGVRADRVEDFPDIWDGDYLFYHYVERAEARGKHGTILKCRGRGYSFKGGNMLTRNYFLLKASKSYAFADETEYLTKDGILTKAWANLNFVDNHTPFTQPRDYKDTEMQKRASYKDVENKTEKGFMSEIIGVTCKNDVQKGRGKRGKLLFFDESGSFPGLKQIWGIARKSVEQGRYVYGFMVTAGTGGTQGADFEAAEAFFYQPNAYNILALRNVFDIRGTGDSGLFIPEYLNRQGCYDKDGNSDVTKAMVETMHQRQKVRINSNDPNDIVREKAEAPITPQEAVLRTEGSLFPIQDLKDYLATISVNLNKFTSSHYIGRIGMDGNDVKFIYNENLSVIREFPIRDNKDKQGAVEIFELPVKVSDFIDPYRYIAGIDSYDDDHSTTNSLGSIFIFDRFTDRIVAEYTGRPNTANEFYEICLRLLKLYGAKANYENDKKGLYGYFYNKNALHYLVTNPEILGEKDLAKITNNYGNKKYGTNSGVEINRWGRRLQADWLVANAYGTGGTDEEGKEIPPIMNLQQVRSIGYLKELISWHPDMNCDRVSAMGMLMILREDMKRMEIRESTKRAKDIFDDPFFNRNSMPKDYNAISYAF
jgi:hypothetical protein